MIIPIIQVAVNEIEYILNYIETSISKFKLNELTAGNMGDIPSIVGAHPLALEYGNMLNADSQGGYTSILPAIGVELLDESDNNPQYLGSSFKSEEVTQTFLTTIRSVDLKSRINQGMVLSDSNLNLLQGEKTNKGVEKLYAKTWTYLKNQSVNVSIWSDNWKITRILQIVLGSILDRMKHDISKEGAKNVSITATGGIYNYEFSQTLFGAEFNLRFINTRKESEIDSELLEIKHVNESILRDEDEYPDEVTFVGKGE